MKKNKRGWIRIVEAIVAILLITGVLLAVIQQRAPEKKDISSNIYEIEKAILREIQLDDGIRNEILDMNLAEDAIPASVMGVMGNLTPSYLTCEANIYGVEDDYVLGEGFEEEVYVQSVIITSTLETYDPREVKLFCWMK